MRPLRTRRTPRLFPFAARCALAVVAASCVAASAAAQVVEGGDGEGAPGFAIAEWNTENGLPSNAVRDIRQTADGFIWIASYEGLVRFDGVAFRAFGEGDIPGVHRASFRRLAVDR
ncbi:MAG: two-component regulator propeller domain-containing protein, partial [Longimicrobiaceae bacterium]